MEKNYYDILGVDRESTQDEIKKAYRTKAKEHHPDKEGGSEEKFKEAAEAYETLSDPKKRQNYDTFGSSGGPGGFSGSFNMEDIFSQFEDIFGGGFGSFGGRRQRRRGNDIKVKTTLSLIDIMFGSERKIKYNRHTKCAKCDGVGGSDTRTCRTCNGAGQRVVIQQTPVGRIQQIVSCGDCQGQGSTYKTRCREWHGEGVTYKEEVIDIKIPAGAVSGMQLTMQGNGNHVKGGDPGDLYIIIDEMPDKKFKREGINLYCDEWITISDAVLGTKIDVDTPTGNVDIKIDQGCESGKVFTIRGKGIPNIGSNGSIYGNGDLHIKVNVKIPKITSTEQKLVFEKLKEIL